MDWTPAFEKSIDPPLYLQGVLTVGESARMWLAADVAAAATGTAVSRLSSVATNDKRVV